MKHKERGVRKLLKERRLVIEYARERQPSDPPESRGRPVGVVLVWRANNGKVKVGTASHNPKDPYDQEQGYRIALARGVDVEDMLLKLKLPWSQSAKRLKPVVERAISRAIEYFKGPKPKPESAPPAPSEPSAPAPAPEAKPKRTRRAK